MKTTNEFLANTMAAPNVYTYLEFRKYLKDYYSFRKKLNPRFSYRVFARMAGFKTGSLLQMIINGERNLTPNRTPQLAASCKLTAEESKFFHILVLWNQSINPEEKELYWNDLARSKPKVHFDIRENPNPKILSRWFIFPLLEFFRLKGFVMDSNWIANRFFSKVTSLEMEEAIQTLTDCELIKIDSQSKVVPTDKLAYFTSKISNQHIQAYHESMFPLASKALKKVGIDKREFGAVSIAIAPEDIPKYKKEINQFYEKICQKSQNSDTVKEVYQLNLQFFPISKDVEEK